MGVSFDKIDGVIWYDGRLVPWADANVHILTHGLHYASCVFEGERAYGGKVFKSTAHSERLKNSASILDFEIPYSVAEIDAAKQLVIDKQQSAGCLSPPDRLARLGDDGRVGADQHHPPRHRRLELAELFRSGREAEGHPHRVWPSTGGPIRRPIPAMAKASGLYMICTISKHKAERAGYADAMMLDWQGRVAECTGANIFFIKDGKIHTPIADCFLAGITRATAIDLARRRGIEVIERRIMPEELSDFTECFITGTAAEVTPVSEIANWKFTPGKISEQLMADYTAEVQPKGKAVAA